MAGDFNGDGRLDLATADYYSNAILVLLNKGDGTFQPETQNVATLLAVRKMLRRVISPATAGSTSSPQTILVATRSPCSWATATARSRPRNVLGWNE